jgi:GTP cyclohydrolase I
MSATEPRRKPLPDVAVDAHPQAAVALEWVGMQGISVPLLLDGDPTRMRTGSARLDAGVNLVRGDARGIHMSRLYALASGMLPHQPLTPATLHELLRGFLDSHADLSDRAQVTLDFDLLLERDALLSELSGWKSYPVTLEASLAGARMQIELGVRVGYSSTCPASAALARQLVRQRFDTDFAGASPTHRAVSEWLDSEQGICATPHGQRSEADVRVRLAAIPKLPLAELIDSIESALATPLQTAVKREDEQEFARLNGENLMFCEDAARRVYAALDGDARYAAFRIRCAHFESLHPHDAVAVAARDM